MVIKNPKSYMNKEWKPLILDTESVTTGHGNAIHQLAKGDIPAVIVRHAYPEQSCQALLERLFKRQLFEGFAGCQSSNIASSKIERFDLGTSLGNLFSQPQNFFAHSAKTNTLYKTLFDGLINPIDVLYAWLAKLAVDKSVMTAREPDGREYGATIFRCHMPNWGYPPHMDSVRNMGSSITASKNERTQYAVYRFNRQLGGVLLLQSPEDNSASCDSIMYRCEWGNEIEAMMETVNLGLNEPKARMINVNKFDDYVSSNTISTYEVSLSPGDLYFFRADSPHAIPRFIGQTPRITMATFIGYSPEDPDVFVWS